MASMIAATQPKMIASESVSRTRAQHAKHRIDVSRALRQKSDEHRLEVDALRREQALVREENAQLRSENARLQSDNELLLQRALCAESQFDTIVKEKKMYTEYAEQALHDTMEKHNTAIIELSSARMQICDQERDIQAKDVLLGELQETLNEWKKLAEYSETTQLDPSVEQQPNPIVLIETENEKHEIQNPEEVHLPVKGDVFGKIEEAAPACVAPIGTTVAPVATKTFSSDESGSYSYVDSTTSCPPAPSSIHSAPACTVAHMEGYLRGGGHSSAVTPPSPSIPESAASAPAAMCDPSGIFRCQQSVLSAQRKRRENEKRQTEERIRQWREFQADLARPGKAAWKAFKTHVAKPIKNSFEKKDTERAFIKQLNSGGYLNVNAV